MLRIILSILLLIPVTTFSLLPTTDQETLRKEVLASQEYKNGIANMLKVQMRAKLELENIKQDFIELIEKQDINDEEIKQAQENKDDIKEAAAQKKSEEILNIQSKLIAITQQIVAQASRELNDERIKLIQELRNKFGNDVTSI